MSVGRYVRGLNAYDLLGNLIPGTIGLVAIIGFLSSPPIPNDVGEYGLFIAVAFVIGAINQAYASKAAGSRESFDKTMNSVEDLSSLQYQEHEPEGGEGAQDGQTKEGSGIWILHPFIGPLCGWWRPKRGEKMDDAILANRIWTHLVDTHEIPFETESYSVLYHVLLSRVDNIQSPSRAIRIQAIRNFYRGMWITAWYSLLLIMIAIIADWRFEIGDTIPWAGVEYAQSAYFEYWDPIWHLAVIAVIGVLIFWLLFESTEEDYLEYLFADYAVSIGTEGTSIAFEDENSLAISGDIQTRVRRDTIPIQRNDTIKSNGDSDVVEDDED